MKKTINILGAFDRYNYGDLLFPIIIKEYIKKYRPDILSKYDIELYGLINNDLSRFCGHKTKALKKLYSQGVKNGSFILVAGGDVLHAKTSNLALDLCRNRAEFFFHKIFRKIVGKKRFDTWSEKKIGINTGFPWIIDETKFNGCAKVIYNSVGASDFDKLTQDEQLFIKAGLRQCSYLSVRDNQSMSSLNGLDLFLAPDSAVMMSEFFPKEKMAQWVGKRAQVFVASQNKYIVMQSNYSTLNGRAKEAARTLNIIKKKLKCEILLLALGIAPTHGDCKAVIEINKRMENKCIYLNNLNIFENMYLIANSIAFAGTSLHGNITAMSYGLPHVGLNKKITKLRSYFNTWVPFEGNFCVDLLDADAWIEAMDLAIKIEKEKLEKTRQEMITKSKKNFEKILSFIRG